MIENASQLNASLHQLSSMVDSLQAAHLDCERRNDWRLFPLMSEGLVTRIRELNADIREYLGSNSDSDLVIPGAPNTDEGYSRRVRISAPARVSE